MPDTQQSPRTHRRFNRVGALTRSLSGGLVVLAAFAFSPTARATLGQPADSASNDGTPVSGLRQLRQSTSASQIQDQHVMTPGGIQVHEFSANGTVFAITWSGTSLPDLQQLLGSYFPTYAQAMQARGAQRRAPVAVDTSAVVVRNWGHMRAYGGSAYVPALVPAGTDLASLGVVQ